MRERVKTHVIISCADGSRTTCYVTPPAATPRPFRRRVISLALVTGSPVKLRGEDDLFSIRQAGGDENKNGRLSIVSMTQCSSRSALPAARLLFVCAESGDVRVRRKFDDINDIENGRAFVA